MGEHHGNIHALLKQSQPAKPQNLLGAQVHGQFQKKETVLLVKPEHYREVDGKGEFFLKKDEENEPAWTGAPEGYTVKVLGQPLEMADLDWVVSVISTCQHHGAIAGPRGEQPMTVIPITEIFRADATKFIASHKAVLSGPEPTAEPTS